MLAKNTFFAELVRLPLLSLTCSIHGACASYRVTVKSFAHHLQQYLVNMDFDVAHTVSQPNLSQDLFSLYGLNDIAATVARTLPNGEKNSLRKTYKGKIKELGVSGKFDVVKRNDDAPDGLLAMVRLPDEEWAFQNRRGNEIENGLSAHIRANLPMAMKLTKDIVPKSMWDSSVLGELDIPEVKPAALSAPAKAAPSVGTLKGLHAPISQPRAIRADVARPKRNVKKRGYEDSSFEGYGEGYVDDDMADPGYSTGEGDDMPLAQRKKRKVCSDELAGVFRADPLQNASSHNYPGGPMRHNSYGPGMVGA
jgi:hypothetical protein